MTCRMCTVAVITGSRLPLSLGIQLIFRGIIMEAHGNIEAAAATEHGSESRDATTPTDSDATEHAAEVQARGSPRIHHQVMLQSAPPPIYEVELLQYWARSRPVARIFMATVADRRACRALRATWALHCMALLGAPLHGNGATCRGCGHYPTYRTCVGCHIKWCSACHTWSQVCWKCYRPRHELHDCGEFLGDWCLVEQIERAHLYLHRLGECLQDRDPW